MIDILTMKPTDTRNGTNPAQNPSPGQLEPDPRSGHEADGTSDEVLGTEACEPASSPQGTPPALRDLIARTLETNDPTAIAAAEQDYRGAYESLDAYVLDQVAEHLAPHLRWVLGYCRPEGLRSGYEGGAIRLWTIALADGRVAVFESAREPGEQPTP
jgi:hypothetical protein